MEWKKVLINRKLSALILVLFVLQLLVFGEDCRRREISWQERYGEAYDTHLAEEEQQYRDSFQVRIKGIVDQADSMDEISIFAKEESFSKRNATRTKEAFAPLAQIALGDASGRTVTELFAFRFGNGCLLLCAFAIALELSEIRKRGVRSITFTTAYGKLRHAIEKKMAFFLWAFFLVAVFHLGIFAEGILLFHEDAYQLLSCPVQTFSCFADFTLCLNTGSAILLYLLYRTVILYIIMVIVWSVSVVCNHTVLAVGFCGSILAIEYFLYAKIADTHVLKLLKFCNVWYQAIENGYFLKYRNLNLLEYAVNLNTVILVSLLASDLLGSIVAIYICCTRYPVNVRPNRLYKILYAAGAWFERARGTFLEKCSLAGMEMYKVLIVQKGLVAVLLLILLLFFRVDFTQIQRSTQQELYYSFINHYLGVPDGESAAEIARLDEKLAQVDETYIQQVSVEEQDGGIGLELAFWYASFEEERKFLMQIRQQTESLEEIAQESGIAVWYVNQHSYDHLLRSDDVVSSLGLLFVVLWNAVGVYAGENGSGMVPVMKSCSGEPVLCRKKRRVAVTLSLIVYLLVVFAELAAVAGVYEIRGVRAPVQSILELSQFPLHCTIWQYFLGRYAVKYLLFLLLCYVVCAAAETIVYKKGWANGIKNRKSV